MSRTHPRSLLLLLFGALLAAGVGYLLTVQVLVKLNSPDAFAKAAALPNFVNMLIVNLLIGFSILLFVTQTGWRSLRVLLTVIAALLIGLLVLILISSDPFKAYNTLITAPLNRVNRWGAWIDDALALMLVGLATTVVFRARLFSLGAEGQMYVGAMATGLVALGLPTGLPIEIHIPLAIAAGCIGGFLASLIPAFLRAYLGADELVSTLMLNPIIALLYEFVLDRIKPADKNFLVSADFPESALFPNLVAPTRVSTAVFYVAAAVVIIWLIIQRTPLGYEIRMIGANPKFARYGGIRTRLTILLTMGLSGMMAGTAGSYMSMVIYEKLQLGFAAGLAFEGVVVALLAGNNPLGVPAMALLYAYLRAGGQFMQSDANVSIEIVRIIQAVIILLFTAEGLTNFLRWRKDQTALPSSTAPQPQSQEAI